MRIADRFDDAEIGAPPCRVVRYGIIVTRGIGRGGTDDVGDFGSDERVLFESAGIALYEEIVAMGGIAVDDPRLASDSLSAPPSTC